MFIHDVELYVCEIEFTHIALIDKRVDFVIVVSTRLDFLSGEGPRC